MASSLGVVGVLNSEYATKKAVEHIRNSLNFMMIPSVSVQEMFELEFLPEFCFSYLVPSRFIRHSTKHSDSRQYQYVFPAIAPGIGTPFPEGYVRHHTNGLFWARCRRSDIFLHRGR